MQITIFSVWMTFVWCSIFIVLCYILRKRSVLLNLSSMTGIIILYLFCLIRLVVPVELPWTKVVSGGSLYNFLYQIFGCEITCVARHEIYVYHIFVVAWGVVMAVLLTRYLIQYHRVVSYFSEMEKTEDTELNNILDEICTDKEKRNVKIVQTAAVEVPCCIGIFEKRILIPDKKYSREELHYIILHEYTHLDNKDILTIQLINILCIVFWWNPFVYILKGDMYQSIEIRCDQTVTKKLKSAERGNYLTVILKEYKASVQGKEFRKPAGAMPLFEDHSDHLIERFRLVAEGQQSSSRIGRILVPVIAVALLVLSYSFILQPRYETPDGIYDVQTSTWDIDQGNAYLHEKNGKYYLHSNHKDILIDRESMELMRKSGFKFQKEETNMKKRFLIAAAICASLFVVGPTVNVSAAEVEQDVQEQSVQNDIGVAPYADEIVMKFRVHNNKVQYRRWNQTRGYWVDKDWITLK